MNDSFKKAMLGALVANAVSMPAHWYDELLHGE